VERGNPVSPPFVRQANRKARCWRCGRKMLEKAKAIL
jgi:DNA-directed RNA polymerase subunit RPC12/RpoP